MDDGRLEVLDHPLVAHRVRTLRDHRTQNREFSRLVDEVSRYLAYEAFRDAPVVSTSVDTPLVAAAPAHVVDEEYLIVPILRAGLGMVAAIQGALPRSRVSLVGVRRDEATLAPDLYLDGLPLHVGDVHAVVCDPMLATGRSLACVLGLLESRGVRRTTVLCLVAAVPGVAHVTAAFPRTRVVAAALDPALDDRGFIVPGLGDAGDRLFGVLER